VSRKRSQKMHWYVMDLHLHTPASSDYQQPEVTYLDILRRAEARGLDIIAFTDHNTVAGYRQMQEEIRQLELLESLNRLLPEEKERLEEYRRLLSKILVLPGFEFTATLGFHILGIFPPEKPVREIEHLLLTLNIPPEKLDQGSATVGATSDVLTAYRLIDEAGGLVIAAHANSSNGVAARNVPGQTKISYTQDPHLHALEVTDLEKKGRHTTAAFFNGTKPEYPRRMHCIQGSDAHRLFGEGRNLGVGDRATEVLLPEVSFQALKELFLSNDFARHRPHRLKASAQDDFIQQAREEGANLIQDFHEKMTVRGGRLYAIIADICAFANTNGGTLYIGVSKDPKKPPAGIENPDRAVAELAQQISERIIPPLDVTIDVQETRGKKVLRVLVPRGNEPPYAVDGSKIYIRSESETGLAVRDEIVELVLRGLKGETEAKTTSGGAAKAKALIEPVSEGVPPLPKDAPRTGVEVISVTEREGTRYYTLRDLRNGNVVKNVTTSSARRLWHYAISQYDKLPADICKMRGVHWEGDRGVMRKYKQGKRWHFDLVQRTPEGNRYFFGVTEEGLTDPWKPVVGVEE